MAIKSVSDMPIVALPTRTLTPILQPGLDSGIEINGCDTRCEGVIPGPTIVTIVIWDNRGNAWPVQFASPEAGPYRTRRQKLLG
jgi:hypothetical protein